jgi:hypothetical protein
MSDINVIVNDEIVNIDVIDEPVLVNVINSPGVPGAPGQGVPVGGTTGQVLAKNSATNYDTAWVNVSGGAWGTITGTLSNQTDLQNALNAKFDDPTGTTAQYLRGDGTLATFPALTGFVPYTGATGAVNLGAFDLTVNELTIGKGLNSVANNTALGKRTLFHTTTGNYNTAVGHEAGHNLTTGQYNTAIGQSAMFTATSAAQNTAIGVNALLLATSGGSNVAVGLDSLQHITTGSSNTAIGYNAGSHITGGSTPNTTASNSVFIGRDSKAGADGQTNQIVIGQNAVGNGSNTATFGNTATTANYFTGSINGGSFVKSGGTSSQFLKADGSVDSSVYVPTSTELTINGVTFDLSANRTFTVGSVTGSGASGQVAYWNGTSSQSGSNNLFWDAANSALAIGGTTIDANIALQINSSKGIRISGSGGGFGYSMVRGSETSGIGNNGSATQIYSTNTLLFNTGGSEAARFNSSQRLLIGSTTDSGERLQVTGNVRIVGGLNGLTVRYTASALEVATFTSSARSAALYLPNTIDSAWTNLIIRANSAQSANITEFQNSGGTVLSAFNKDGNLIIGSSSVNASAILQADSTTKGFLPPRMTTTQKNAIATPAAGLVVYDTTLNKLCVYTTAWETITSL